MLLTVVLFVVFGGAIIWLALQVFGSQVLGLPAMIALFAFVALADALSRSGLLAVTGALAGVLLVWMIIGMAMTHGADEYAHGDDESPDAD